MVINALAATEPGGMLKPFEFAPAALGPMDVEIEVICCGVCASDLHMLKNDWGMTAYPFVPGHEVIGTVRAVGEAVTTIFTGMRVGVGWQSGACMECEWCKVGEHELCRGQMGTCVQRHGGFADRLRVDSRFAIPIPDGLDSPHAAPLLCAGITAFSPFIHYNVRPTMRVGVIGVGGLGHLGLQFARAFGCEVWALSSTADKEQDAERFGAEHFVVSSDEEAVKALTGRLDFILSAVSADLDWPTYVRMLRPKGTLCFVGVPKCDLRVTAFALIDGRKSIVGSPIGSPAMQTKMLKFAARRGVKPMVEAMPMAEANAAFERLHRNQARYRIVLTT